MELHINAEKVLKNNIEIMYWELEKAIKTYIKEGHYMGELKYVNAYLCATINSIVAYVERLIKAQRLEEDDIVQALKYVNNLQKHNPQLVSVPKAVGGFCFPLVFTDSFRIPEINIVWDDCIGLDTKKASQKDCYEKYFKQRGIIDTLKPIVVILLNTEGTISFKEIMS